MGRLLENLLRESSLHRVEVEPDGFAIVRRDGDLAGFDRLARELIDKAGGEFVAFPAIDPANPRSYDRVFIVPIAD